MTKKTKTHAEREAEVAKLLGLRYSKNAPNGASNSSIGRKNASAISSPARKKRTKKK